MRGLVDKAMLWGILLTALLPFYAESADFDVVVYGGTGAGLVAGIEAKRSGKSVVIIEPSSRIGGLTTSGAGESIDNPAVTGGLAREFYDRVEKYYQSADAWTRQERVDYQYRYEARTGTDAYQIWAFEPAAALSIFEQWLKETGIDVVRNERLDLKAGVTVGVNRIEEIKMESGRTFRAKVFIDATREGDLMACAGVGHDLSDPVEQSKHAKNVQPFTYRLSLTDDPSNLIPFTKPEDYDDKNYTVVFDQIGDGSPWTNVHAPNNKVYVNGLLYSSENHFGYATSSYAEREVMETKIRALQAGLMWTLGNHPSISRRVRHHAGKFGVCSDEYVDGWPDKLYFHSLRQMHGVAAVTTDHIYRKDRAEDPVATGFDDDVTYGISYRAIVPREDSVENLVVPVCLSASPAAARSISKQSILMSLGQAAGAAASLAIDDHLPVQKLDYAKLRQHLEAGGQVIDFHPYTKISSIEGIVVDDSQAELVGIWIESEQDKGIHRGYHHDGADYGGEKKAVYKTDLPEAGEYEVQISYPALPTRANQVPVTVKHAAGKEVLKVNQQKQPEIDRMFTSLGKFRFEKTACVTISNQASNGSVVVDAVRWLRVR